MQDVPIGETHLGHVHADVEPGHGRSSNLPWVMTAAPPAGRLECERLLVDAIRIDGQVSADRCRRRKPHCHPPDPARVPDAHETEKAMGTDRHGAQSVGEQEVEAGPAQRAGVRSDAQVPDLPRGVHLEVAELAQDVGRDHW